MIESGMKNRILKRTAALLTGLFLLGSMSGCVYYRLYKLKAQLSNFQNYFTVDNSGRPAVLFKQPIIHEADVEWLTGLSPSKRQADGDAVTNVYHFTKIIETNAVPSAYHELIFTFEYEQGRLHRITLPLQFSGFLTETNFMEMLAPIRDAKTDHTDKKTEWTWREMYIQIPNYDRICHYLGKPSLTSSNAVTRDPLFRYTLKGHLQPDPRFEFPWRMDYRVWNYNNRMYDVDVNVGRLFVYIDVSKEDKVVKMDIRK
jgi:hypothetical protein